MSRFADPRAMNIPPHTSSMHPIRLWICQARRRQDVDHVRHPGVSGPRNHCQQGLQPRRRLVRCSFWFLSPASHTIGYRYRRTFHGSTVKSEASLTYIHFKRRAAGRNNGGALSFILSDVQPGGTTPPPFPMGPGARQPTSPLRVRTRGHANGRYPRL